MNTENKLTYLEKKQEEFSFSGSFFAQKGKEVLIGSNGYANRSEQIENQANTRFSIASGSKLFTSAAICLLVEQGKLSFDTKLAECLPIEFPHFDHDITVHHLLTHTSGVPDYFNEEVMDDYEELWLSRPSYTVREPHDFLPMFQSGKMQAAVGGPFEYNNSGYILLGLLIEHVAKCSFSEFVEQQLFAKADMQHAGYFEMDHLPERTALGYIESEEGTWRTNLFSLPAKGGPDGGAYLTAGDMVKFWGVLTERKLLTEEMTSALLKPRVVVDEDENIYYGYGGYMEVDDNQRVIQYIQMGYDPGVNFRAIHVPDAQTTIVVCSNESEGAYELLKEVERVL